MNAILEAGVTENREVYCKLDQNLKEIAIKGLNSILNNLNVQEEDLHKLSNAKIIIEFDSDLDLMNIKTDGDHNSLFILTNYILAELKKDITGSNLLDKVTLRADYVKKYQDWSKKLIEEIIKKEGKIDSIEDERGFVGEDEALVIEIVINGKKYQYEIPKEGWSF